MFMGYRKRGMTLLGNFTGRGSSLWLFSHFPPHCLRWRTRHDVQWIYWFPRWRCPSSVIGREKEREKNFPGTKEGIYYRGKRWATCRLGRMRFWQRENKRENCWAQCEYFRNPSAEVRNFTNKIVRNPDERISYDRGRKKKFVTYML